MKIRMTATKFALTPDVSTHVEKKLSKVGKFFPDDAIATINIIQQKNDIKVEITIIYHSAIFRAEVTDKDYLCALDQAEDLMIRQIRKNKTRLEKKKYISKTDVFASEDEAAEEELLIRKIKTFHMTPMSVEEAVMQMNLLSHQFFVFRNAETGNVNVVYSRKDGTYGVIDCID